jgi:hypothetical protein
VAKLGMNFGKKLISTPLAQKVGAAAADAAKKSAANIAADIIAGNNIKESAQRELKDAKEKIATTLRAGRKRKGPVKVKTLKKRKSRPTTLKSKSGAKYCIFD